MFADLNERLTAAKEKMRKKQKWETLLKVGEEHLAEEREKATRYLTVLRKEENDVRKLESMSFANFFYTVIGRKLEKLDREQQEVLAAKLKYDEASKTVEELEKELADLKEKLATVQGCEEEYQALLQEKERLIHARHSGWSEELYRLSEREADLRATLKELDEAVAAGESAERALQTALQGLDKAIGWGMWDMFGGGLIATAVKHSHMDEAGGHIHQAQRHLRHFQNELKDLDKQFDIHLETGNLLTFADFFFDGLIVDWIVQGRISQSFDQVEKVYGKVKALLGRLRKERQAVLEQLDRVAQERRTFVEQARLP